VSEDQNAPEAHEYASTGAGAIPREAQLRLEYFERFGSLLQEQLDAVVTQAATVSREIEREQAEMSAQILRIQQETDALRGEAAALRQEIQDQRAEAAAVKEETEHEQTLMTEQLTRLRSEAEGLVAERDRRQAELNQLLQDRRREQAELSVTAIRLREELSAIETQRNQARAEATVLMEEIERTRRDRLTLAAEVARLEEEAQSLREEISRKREEAEAIVAEAQSQATKILGGVEEGAGVIVTRALHELEALGRPPTRSEAAIRSGSGDSWSNGRDSAGEWEVGGGKSAGAALAEPVETTSRLIVRGATPDRLDDVRRALNAQGDVIRMEEEPGASEGPTLIVMHALGTSLLGILLDAAELRFELIPRGDGTVEIQLVG
jgi:hypothetical protein